MKRKTGLLVLVCILIFALGGCGEKDKTPATGGQTEDTKTPDNTEGGKDGDKASDSSAPEGDGADTQEPDNTPDTGSNEPAKGNAAEGSEYVFETNGVKIVMNAEVAPILEALGEEIQYFEAESCAFQGLDKIYYYPGFELHTYPVEETDYVSRVMFSDDSVTTPEGLYLGAPESDITALYGELADVQNGLYNYTNGDCILAIIAENGVVTSIDYTAITE